MAFYRDEKGRLIRKDGSLAKTPDRTGVDRRGSMGHSSVDRALGGDGPMRDQYERLAADPNTTVRGLMKWFAERKLTVSRGAIDRHRRRYFRNFLKVREAGELANAFCAVLRANGAAGFLEASQGRIEASMMQDLFALQEKPGFQAEQWHAWAKTLGELASSRRCIDEVAAESRRRAAETVKAADAAAKRGASGAEIAERVRQILGA
jgi:hypothetical protein